MEYFKILNLSREPFSNSPEPDFFFQSPTHVRCLQKLELAIRLRRGLNVVMGRVGTGKTTLCRHLIAQFAQANEEADAVETHLLMDPAFSTPLEFLSTVALGFGINGKRKRRTGPDPDVTDWQLKENIKNYLFTRGVGEKKIVVLLIDEGQKLPDFCLEILREFLNYETNENKLLQIVIFAQPEFQQILNRMENVADRVNLVHMLEPLSFKETRGLIQFRLNQASEPGHIPALFTRPALRAVYQATGGYPRKIITLCHQVMLAMIIQNRSKAGWFLVRSCASRLAIADTTWRPRSLRRAALLAILAGLLVLLAVYPPRTDWVKGLSLPVLKTAPTRTAVPPAPEAPSAPAAPETSAADLTFTASEISAPTTPAPAIPATATPPGVPPAAPAAPPTAVPSAAWDKGLAQRKPPLLGRMTLKEGRAVWGMLRDVYGQCTTTLFQEVTLANPHIGNFSRVPAGAVIHLPALSVEKNPLASNPFWVQIRASNNLEEIYEFYRTHKAASPPLRFLPYWNPRQGMVFSVLLKNGLPDEASARRSIARLPAALASGARVVTQPEPGTVFYSR
ncbi:MAG TPA: AAA family ATPase [Syntrophales bacterium]|nr:AAA family ATPase [Syntrophales bacterium]